MKKVLALVLALAMVLGCFSFVSAAASDIAGLDCEPAVNVLTSLEIVTGYTDGTFKPEKVVTRAEMATFIVKALGIAPKTVSSTTFSDVPATHWAAPFVDYANALGIIKGYTDGTFKPDQIVTYNEAITMVVKALGYRDEALVGSYPASYVNMAMNLGLLDDVQAGTAGAVRGDIAMLVYAAMGCDLVTISSTGYVYTTSKDMFARHNVYKQTNYIIDRDDVEDAVIDIKANLGDRTTVWFNDDDEIIAIESVKSKKLVGEWDDDDEEFAGYSIKSDAYTKNSAGYTVFVNGDEYLTTTSAFTWEEDVEYTVAATVSGKYITRIDTIALWNAAATVQLTDDDIEDFADDVYELAGYTFRANNSDEIKAGSYVLEGAESLSALKEDDIVTFYLDSDGKIAKVAVGTKITATPTKLSSDKKTLTIEGKKYDMFGTMTFDTTTYALNAEYDFYVTAAGEIWDFEAAENTVSAKYGVLVACGADAAGWTDGTSTYGVKLFTAEGKTVSFEMNKAVREELSAQTGADWKTDVEARLGTVYVYNTNSNGVLTSMAAVSAAQSFYESDVAAFSDAGIFDGHKLGANAIAFKTEDGTAAYVVNKDSDDEFNLVAGNVNDLYDTEATTNVIYHYNTTTKRIDYIIYKLGASSDEELHVFADFESAVKDDEDVYELTFYFNGEKEEVYYAHTTDTVLDDLLDSTGSAVSLTVDGDRFITAVTKEDADDDAAKVDSSLKVTNGVYTYGGTDYNLSDSIVVYLVKADGTVSVKTTKLFVNSDYDGCSIKFYDTDSDNNDEYDVAIVAVE